MLHDAGAEAVALGTWNNAATLAAAVKKMRPRVPLALATTANTPDTEEFTKTAELAAELENTGTTVSYAMKTAEKLKSPVDDTAAIREAIKEDTKKAEKAERPGALTISGADFVADAWDGAIGYFRQYNSRKTGFEDIDKYLTLYPGLAILTGVSSLGKTSFAVQLADQLADAGETVLFFSLEQAPIELFTKSLTRKLAARGTDLQMTNTEIRNGATCPNLEKVKKEYCETTGRRVFLTEASFETTADDIVEGVRGFEARHKVRPVVIIDYLQLLAAPQDPAGRRLDDRGRVDDAVKKLRRLAVDDQIFILAISNMARASYNERIAPDSFKESGAIEYTADYLFGLQLAVLEEDEFFKKTGSKGGEKETIKAEKQKQIDAAFQETPRRVVFKCIKNRNGRKDFKAYFIYEPKYDSFWKDPAKHEEGRENIRYIDC